MLLLLVLSGRTEAAPPLVLVEAQLGGGMAVGGAPGHAVVRAAPFTLTALAELTLNAQPWLTGFAEAFVEGVDRIGFGLGGGVRVRPGRVARLGAGVVGLVAPYTLGGVTVSAGACLHVARRKSVHVCADLAVNVYFFGGDLPPGSAMSNIGLQLGAGFDAY
jgi:hypothetical protein